MANSTFKGVNATSNAASIPALSEGGQQAAVKKVMYDTYVLTADLASGDKIRMGGLIPAGAKILNVVLVTGALGGSCTVDVGWEASADGVETETKTGFFSGAVVSAAACSTFSTATTPTLAGFGKKFSSPVQISVWEKAVSSSATGLSISLMVEYVEC